MPYGKDGSTSILTSTIDDLIEIHEYIDEKRKVWLEQFRKICEQAKEKQVKSFYQFYFIENCILSFLQAFIRQTMSDLRDNYERSQRKFDVAEANFKKFV